MDELTQKQEEQIGLLIEAISSQSKLFESGRPQLVKVPFSTLKEVGISYTEAVNLLGFVNRIAGADESTIWVLNGTFVKYQGVIGTMRTEIFEELDDVSLQDEKEYLILWLYDFKGVRKRISSYLGRDISEAKLHSAYVKGEIVVAKRRLSIKQNSNYDAFCKAVFKYPSGKVIGYASILEKMRGQYEDDFGEKDWKSLSNLVANLNLKLRGKNIPSLFSQNKRTVIRIF